MCYKHDECSNWFGSKSLAMSLLQKVSSSGYTLGCYYDPFPPYHLSGDFHHFEANLSVAACVKLCGEDGYMLAGLRWRILTPSFIMYASSSTSGTVNTATVEALSPQLTSLWDTRCVGTNAPLRSGPRSILQTLGQ